MLVGALAAGAIGAAFDQVTVTISAEYFLEGKGLAGSDLPLRLGAACVGFRGAAPLGALVVGLALIDEQRGAGRRIRAWAGEIARHAAVLLPLSAALMAVGDPFGIRAESDGHWSRESATRYLLCWGLHVGAYAAVVVACVRRMGRARR